LELVVVVVVVVVVPARVDVVPDFDFERDFGVELDFGLALDFDFGFALDFVLGEYRRLSVALLLLLLLPRLLLCSLLPRLVDTSADLDDSERDVSSEEEENSSCDSEDSEEDSEEDDNSFFFLFRFRSCRSPWCTRDDDDVFCLDGRRRAMSKLIQVEPSVDFTQCPIYEVPRFQSVGVGVLLCLVFVLMLLVRLNEERFTGESYFQKSFLATRSPQSHDE
jgi:hypothetical protein